MQDTSEISAMILAGGLGTRLRTVVSDRPKVLAEVCGRPFMAYLLDQLVGAGFRNAVIGTGYMADQVEQTFGDTYGPLKIKYSKETKPLGTGGALRLAMPSLNSEAVLVMNGDSFIDADLKAFAKWFFEHGRKPTILLTKLPDTSRFGRVILGTDSTILSFEEKSDAAGPGWINAGVYLLTRTSIATIEPGRYYSLEREFFPGLAGKSLRGYCVEDRFIDIGTPEAYAAAEQFFDQAKKTRRTDNLPASGPSSSRADPGG